MKNKILYQDSEIIKFELTQNKICIIDKEDWNKISQYQWRAVNNNEYYYAITRSKSNAVLMHRMLLNQIDPKIKIDHKDHDTLNNRKLNLRLCTNKGNTRNAVKHHDGIIPYKGVTFDKGTWSKNKYKARIVVNYKLRYLGLFETPEEAALAYNQAAIKYFGEFAYLNKIG